METIKINTAQEALQQHLAMEQVKACKTSFKEKQHTIYILVDIIAAPITAKETEKANIRQLTESLDQGVVM